MWKKRTTTRTTTNDCCCSCYNSLNSIHWTRNKRCGKKSTTNVSFRRYSLLPCIQLQTSHIAHNSSIKWVHFSYEIISKCAYFHSFNSFVSFQIPSPFPNVSKYWWCTCASTGRDSAPKRIVYLCVATMFQITCIYFVATFFFYFFQSFAHSHVYFAGRLATFMTTTRSCNSFFFVRSLLHKKNPKTIWSNLKTRKQKKKTRKKQMYRKVRQTKLRYKRSHCCMCICVCTNETQTERKAEKIMPGNFNCNQRRYDTNVLFRCYSTAPLSLCLE